MNIIASASATGTENTLTVQNVQNMIDALDSVEAVEAMDTDGQNAVYMEVSEIWDAYYELSEDEQHWL